MRIRTKWTQKEKTRSLDEVTGAVATAVWKIAGNAILNLENEGFETETNQQRLWVIQEYTAFMVHIIDRMVYAHFNQDQRVKFLTSLAMHLARHYQENMVDAAGKDDYKKPFLEVLNQRMSDYAEFGFPDNQPDFGMRRLLGENVTAVMGPKDRKWITDQVMDIEVPEVMEALEKTMKNLMPNPVAVDENSEQ